MLEPSLRSRLCVVLISCSLSCLTTWRTRLLRTPRNSRSGRTLRTLQPVVTSLSSDRLLLPATASAKWVCDSSSFPASSTYTYAYLRQSIPSTRHSYAFKPVDDHSPLRLCLFEEGMSTGVHSDPACAAVGCKTENDGFSVAYATPGPETDHQLSVHPEAVATCEKPPQPSMPRH